MPDPRPTRGKHRRPPRKTKQERKQAPNRPPEPSAPGRVIVGEVRKPWGRDGLLAVTLNSGRDTVIAPGWTIYLNGDAHTVSNIRPGGRGATVPGVDGLAKKAGPLPHPPFLSACGIAVLFWQGAAFVSL